MPSLGILIMEFHVFGKRVVLKFDYLKLRV